MARKTLVAQDVTPEEALGFQEPTVTGDEVNVNGAPRLMDVPAEPANFNISPPVGGNDVAPQPQGALSPTQQMMQMLNSPEYKQRLAQLQQRSQQALDEQRQGIQQNESIADQIRQPKTNYAPLYNLIDQWTGSHLMNTYQNPDDRNAMLLKLNNLIQGQRGQLTKDEIENMKEQLAGPNSPLGTMKQLAQTDYYNRYAPGGPVEQLQVQRQDKNEHLNVLKSLDTDKTNTQRLASTSNIANSLGNFMNADISSPSQLEELQQTIRGSLGIKGPGGVNERERTYLETLAGNIQKAQQFWKGPQDLKDPTKGPVIRATIQHLKDIAQMEQQNFQNQADQRMGALVAGHEDVYGRHPDWRDQVQNKINAALGQYAPSKVKPLSGQSNNPNEVIEDGYRFKGGDKSDKDNWEKVE